MRRALAGDAPTGTLEFSIFDADSRKLPVEYTAAPVTDQDGNVLGGVALFSDITERLALEKERATFLSMLVHDMKTPLVGIMGFARLMLEKGEKLDDAQRHQYTDVIMKEGKRLQNLVMDFLDSAKQGRVNLHLNLEQADAGGIARAVAAAYDSSCKQSGHSIALEIAEEPLHVQIDLDRMRQALGNLLDNALRHSPPGGQVILRALHNGYECVLEVADQGNGIHPQDMPHIFRPFYQGRQRRSGSSGFGLGLAGVKSIVEGHGGVIRASCPPDGGTVFSISIPLDIPQRAKLSG